MQRLIATCRMTRSPIKVVCFTEWSHDEIATRRLFRPHLSRWDFEAYGLCIDRKWLQQRAARPVIYGDEECWRQLSSHQRPFFQLSHSKCGVAWSVEREWRHLGDIDLRELTPQQAIVFVRFESEISAVSLESRWPVICGS
ncbi:MAG: hypothetical protein P8N76_08680 [Pirellulaceae bacterium]|nr:hypothetical protein [Pirellulaceae bacterium]